MSLCVEVRLLLAASSCFRMKAFVGNIYPKRFFTSSFSSRLGGTRTLKPTEPPAHRSAVWFRSLSDVGLSFLCSQTTRRSSGFRQKNLLQGGPAWPVSFIRSRVTDASMSSMAPTFVVMKFDQEGNVTTFEKKKTELCQELSLQARDLRFQHSTSLTARNNCIIIRMASLKAILTPQSLLVLDFRGLGLDRWLVLELAPQLASQSHSLPFEFRALEAVLQHKVNTLQTRLNDVEPVILDTLESLVDPKILSADRSKLHVLLQNSKSLSELETDIKVFKDSLLKILDEDEIIEELCLTKWTDPRVLYVPDALKPIRARQPFPSPSDHVVLTGWD